MCVCVKYIYIYIYVETSLNKTEYFYILEINKKMANDKIKKIYTFNFFNLIMKVQN